jgi:FkbM family methyltransferase
MIIGFNDYKHLYEFNVSGIIHVGAHIGQEYEEYINSFGDIETHWFEPIPIVFDQLKSNLGEKQKTKLYNFALGETDFISDIYLDNGNDYASSSILKPKDHITQFPHIKFSEEDKVQVMVSRLDNFNISGCNMMVLDTQGYELSVLKGSTETLKRIDYLFTEFLSTEMYEGCPSLEEFDNFLAPFNLYRVQTWHTPDNWGDAFYVRRTEK